MNLLTICISFVVSILGVSFPILLQVISKLDEKYSSVHLVQLFKHERDWKLFNGFLISSLVIILLYVVSVLPYYLISQVPSKYITVTLSSLLIISTTTLIIFFIRFVKIILIYYSPYDAVKYFIKKDQETINDTEYIFFQALRDILLFSIKQRNETIALSISDNMHEIFHRFSKSHPSDEMEFPNVFYEMIYKSIEELAKEKIKKLGFLEVRTIGGIWLLGEFSNRKIHETTYAWLWRNLILAIEYERDDMVLQYWKQAHQHISFNLSYDLLGTFKDPSERIKTKDEILQERKRFLEFHYALGGLLLYSKRYQCIKRLFRYTSSMPPKYELLPESMNEVFDQYFRFRDPYDNNFRWITTKYYFPETEGIGSEGIVKYWVCRYTALLLLRQYTIVPHLIYMKPLELPVLPSDLINKKIWIDNLDHFKSLVTEVYEDQKLKANFGLGFLTNEWCNENQTPTPIDIVEQTKINVLEAFDLTKITQSPSGKKVQNFLDTSKSMLATTIEPYLKINNKRKFSTNSNKLFIEGTSAIIDKSAFADNQEAEHMNFNSFLAESLSKKFTYGISETFAINRKKKYLLKQENIFEAITKLNLKSKDHIIISFGQNLLYLKETFKVDGLTEDSFENITILNYPSCNYEMVGETFFILKKTELPLIKFHAPSQEQIEKYSLIQLIKDYELYGSVIDINKAPKLDEELLKSDTSKDLKKSVFLFLFIKTEIQWKQNINMIALTKFSEFQNRGILNDVNDIKPYNKKN